MQWRGEQRFDDKAEKKERPDSCLSVFSGAQSGSNQGDAGPSALNYSLISQQTGEATESCVPCMLLFTEHMPPFVYSFLCHFLDTQRACYIFELSFPRRCSLTWTGAAQ